jgi:hypothetical protein
VWFPGNEDGEELHLCGEEEPMGKVRKRVRGKVPPGRPTRFSEGGTDWGALLVNVVVAVCASPLSHLGDAVFAGIAKTVAVIVGLMIHIL